jgi:hypothetical protein
LRIRAKCPANLSNNMIARRLIFADRQGHLTPTHSLAGQQAIASANVLV